MDRKILEKIVLYNCNIFIIDIKIKLIFRRVLYSLTMILVFKQIYNIIFLRKTTSDGTQRQRNADDVSD